MRGLRSLLTNALAEQAALIARAQGVVDDVGVAINSVIKVRRRREGGKGRGEGERKKERGTGMHVRYIYIYIYREGKSEKGVTKK